MSGRILSASLILMAKGSVRAVLGSFNALCILYFRNGVSNAFGRSTANWYTVFQASGFHVIYYSSRTLSNFFAFGLSRF